MKRLLAIAAVLVVAAVLLVIGTGAGSGDDAYRVRAIFDNAGFLVPGEDVKSAGVVIGTIESLDVTPDKKAAVVLRIEDPAFRDFKQDARCQIRVQSLLGEKYVACQTTQATSENDGRPQPPLRRIEEGPGKGEYLLPITQTSSGVDLDSLNNIMRLPERQRLALIINEFGTGLAGNGKELRAAIRRANPALEEFDRVLRILADENRVLARLADDSDAALGPLARESRSISDFIDKAGITARATAERGDALEANFERFPEFLRQLQPTMERLEQFALEATPVFEDFRAAAPGVNQIFEQLGPFSEASLPTLRTLGDAAETSRRALLAARPVIQDIRQLGLSSKPLAEDLSRGLTSLKNEHGIDRFMQTVLGFSGALNGYDAVSHYLRAQAIVQINCMQVATRLIGECAARFGGEESAESASTATTAQVSGAAPEGALRLPQVALPGADLDTAADATGDDRTASGDSATAGADDGAASEDPRTGLLGYLLGTEAVR
jgi:phospholipid/cholesterol/gamma-HCH transport system substrate-binding protein